MGHSKPPQVIAELQTPTAILGGKRFITDFQIEQAYGIPRKTLQNWRVLGRGPAYRKFGGSVRYDVLALEAWIRSLPLGGAGIPSCAVKSARS